MLADTPHDARSGRLDAGIHLPSTAKRAILDFVARELPNWRDDPERPREQAETRLTEHLCDYLTNATYRSTDLSHIQFRVETGDEMYSGRKIDLSVKPLGGALIIEGRRHNIYETILPIECKRLPTPTGTGRDEREYVFNQHASTGGIQRFKSGHHGASHRLAAMIGYVQQETCEFWAARVIEWINGLIAVNQNGWTAKDLPHVKQNDPGRRVTVLSSSHARAGDATEIELRHLWVQMN
jgi:hypothetical protein